MARTKANVKKSSSKPTPAKNSGGVKKATDKIRKKPRYSLGTLVGRDMKKQSQKTDPIIYKGPFRRMVKAEIAAYAESLGIEADMPIKPEAVLAIQVAAEDYVGRLYEDANRIVGMNGKQRIQPIHVETAHAIQTSA